MAAATAQIFKDMNKAVNLVVLVTPAGAPAVVVNTLAGAGAIANVGAGLTDSTVIFELQKMVAQGLSQKLVINLLQHSPANAARFVAFVDLQQGWDSFVNFVKADLAKPAAPRPQPPTYLPPKNGPRNP